jgi:cell shape-determining protein MreD
MSMAMDRRFDRGAPADPPVPFLRLVLVTAIVLVAHATMFRRLRVAGVGPESFVALAVIGGLELGVAGGAALGVLAGLAADMCTTTSVGVWAFVGGLLGLTMGLVHERAFTDSLKRPPYFIVAFTTAVAVPLQRSVAFVVDDSPFPAVLRLAWILLIAPLWGIAITLPIRQVIRLIIGRRS